MSNVVSPRGPLPPRIYWRRRLVLLAVVMGLILLVGRLLSGGEDGADAEAVADRSAAAPSSGAQAPKPGPGAASDPGDRDAGADPDAARKPTVTQRSQAKVARADAASTSLRGPTGPLAQPEGTCRPAEVAIAPDVEDTDAAGPVPIRLGLSGLGDRACTFSFGPDDVALRITSGDDLIWESLKCSEAIEEQSVVVRPGWLTYVTVTWSGRRGEGCATRGEFAAPGYYWAEAASLGGEPDRSQFELETPPPPKPEPKPKQQDRDSAGAERADGADRAADGADDGAADGDRADRTAGAERRDRTRDSRTAEEPTDEPRAEETPTEQRSRRR